MKKLVLLFFVLAVAINSQSLKENWVPLSSANGSTIYLNSEGIIEYNNGDLFLWVLQKYSNPIKIESVNGKIYSSKTYYLFNKDLKRYSFQQIIYYNEKGDVLTSFSYGTTATAQPYRYNYPIMPNTNEELILSKAIELTPSTDEDSADKGE